MRIDLAQYGFTYTGSCNCGGSHTEKYRSGQYDLRVRKFSFKVKKNGITIASWKPISKLIETIHDLNVLVEA
jgi:hypothetical protein